MLTYAAAPACVSVFVDRQAFGGMAHKGREIIMLESCQNAQERFRGVHLLIDRWLQERHDLVRAYDAVGEGHEDLKSQAHQHFCQILLDYVSAGHFEVYEQLTLEAKVFGDEEGLDLARQIYPRIDVTTEAALAFNDLCSKKNYRPDCEKLAAEFIKLGELLHERFELEDCLIEVLHSAHKEVDAIQA